MRRLEWEDSPLIPVGLRVKPTWIVQAAKSMGVTTAASYFS
jgi:hypothetical protein